MLALVHTIQTNNTPPASRLTFGFECSAPRGVTRLWGSENSTADQQTAMQPVTGGTL